MSRILIPREQADEHPVQPRETLKSIFDQKCLPSGITWEEFAIYNFGTAEPRALDRALIELVGCSESKDDPADSPLDPALRPASTSFKLRIPKVWEAASLEPRQLHVLKIRQRLAPPGVSIATLDRWFLPKSEPCRMSLSLLGCEEWADKASVSVYASKYSTATMAEDGAITYPGGADLASEVIWSKVLEGRVAPRRDPYPIDDWRGESEASKGVLKKRGAARYVNVASSPYTVVARFHKDPADDGARIELAPFWPRFSAVGQALPDSLTFEWSIESTARKMEHGQLLVIDKDGNVVLRKPLAESDISAGKFAWAAGANVLKAHAMPYRAQLQVHTGENEANGLALAAMHTEVRMWVHPDVKHERSNRIADPQCMDFALAPHWPAGPAPALGSDAWYGLRLADLGYHPGPVDGDVNAEDFKMALKELQRSYPKNTAVPFVRLAATGAKDADTTTLLTGARVAARPRFGRVEDDATFKMADVGDRDAETRLNDRDGSGLVLWVDDQHCYTQGAIPAGCDPNIGMGNYRGAMDLPGDGKAAKDLASICRPWIPLSVRPRLLSSGDALDRATPPDWNDAMAGCIGPLRVDWVSTETVPETKPIEKMLAKVGNPDVARVRTLKAVQQAINGSRFKDDDGNQYGNCPQKYGGLRPDKKADLGDYYKQLFGIDAKSLKPWKTIDDSGTKTVFSVIHDDLGQAQERLFADSAGRAGTYFHPFHIGGDTYRVRAEISFVAQPGQADHPNRAVLAARYAARPVAHTTKMSMWRRSAVRAYVKWTRASVDVQATAEKAFEHYRACHVDMRLLKHGEQPLIRNASALVKAATDHTFRNMVVGSMAKAPYNNPANLAFVDNFTWPWANADHFGIHEIPAPDVELQDYREKFLENIWSDTWERFREPMLTYLLDQFEKAYGLYRGHLLVGFASTPAYYVQVYYCSTSRHRNVLIERTAQGNSADGRPCHVTACTGVLAPGHKTDYQCPTCHTQYPGCHESVLGSHGPCEKQCEGMKRPNVNQIGADPVTLTYTCDTCAAVETMDDQSYFVPHAYACGTFCGGNDTPTPLTCGRSVPDMSLKRDSLPVAAVGSALGASFVFEGNDHLNWAHEMGHHRHMEHAAGAPSEKVAQHDSTVNPQLQASADLKPAEKRWDHGCVMGYVNKQFFCSKCVLKNRGWMVEQIAAVAENVVGP